MGKVQREMKHYLNEAAFNELLISREKPMIDFRKHHLIRQVRSKVEVQRWKNWRTDIRRHQRRNRKIYIRLAIANITSNWCFCLSKESMLCFRIIAQMHKVGGRASVVLSFYEINGSMKLLSKLLIGLQILKYGRSNWNVFISHHQQRFQDTKHQFSFSQTFQIAYDARCNRTFK